MSRLKIRHETVYSYSSPVSFKPWRLLMRPLDSHAIRIVDATLEFSPLGQTRWSYDAYGNCVCYFEPEGSADTLSVVNNLIIDRYPAPLPAPKIDNPRTMMPMVYQSSDRAVLEPFIAPTTDDHDQSYLDWMRSLAGPADEPALEYLRRMNNAIHDQFAYGARNEPGVQAPTETIGLNAGTCRDFAWLMIESVRRLGFAARFVTGYLYSPNLAMSGVRGAGATHAWCEVFLPDIGWIEFDPTNGLVESPDLIRVGATRTPAEASPMSGGAVDETVGSTLTVGVDVELVDETLQAA
jgi:transglutaminase-like putative cysteine protease